MINVGSIRKTTRNGHIALVGLRWDAVRTPHHLWVHWTGDRAASTRERPTGDKGTSWITAASGARTAHCPGGSWDPGLVGGGGEG